MELSKHNIFSQINGSENYLLVNLLHGEADILDPETAKQYTQGSFKDRDKFIEKGYLTDADQEKILFKNRYLDFLDNRDNDEVQIFFVPWYACNFNCSYCYQDEYTNVEGTIDIEIITAFFEYINNKFAGRRKYVTLFGGEPLLHGKNAREFLDTFLTMAGNNNIDIAIVTNGYHLIDYIDLFDKCTIREIQVTIDGVQAIHDQRRPLKNSSEGTFERISEGIDRLIENGYNVNLRTVIDRDNIDHLPELASYAIDKGWTAYDGFKTQLGRNYSLHHCQSAPDMLFSRAELWEKLYLLIQSYPEIIEFHKPAFSVSKFLYENGELPDPLFDACPACKTEWAFDYTGKIFPCTATVGKAGDELGTFYPEYSLDSNKVEEWESRDITVIDKCHSCELALACGGGCGSVALNESGNINSPDCNPVRRLLELGISHYFEKE
ncbi:radical SAM protein [bacterium]|nr:radical SAM protein [bacterium]